ncbi:Cache domain-containing protein, partial [Caloramator fervidus]
MKQKMNKLLLRQKLVIIFMLIAVIPAIITTTISLYNSKKLVEAKVFNLTKQIADEKIAFIDSFVEKISYEVNSITTNSGVLNKDNNTINSILKNIKDANPNVLLIYIGDSNKRMNIYPKIELPSDFDPTTRPWYQDAIKSFGNIVITKPYKDVATNKNIITISKAFRLLDGSVAVIGVDVSIDTLISNINKTQVGQTGYAALILEDGTIIAHPNKDMLLVNIAEKYDFGKKIIEMKEGNLKYTDKEEKISGFAKSKQTGWIAIATMNEREYGKEFEKSIIQTVIFLIITLGIVALLAL